MSRVWTDFMSSPYAREVLAALKKEKEASFNKEGQSAYSVNMDRNQLYDVGWHENYLAPSTETQVSTGAGGGSNVGSGERKHLYDVPQGATMGGEEAYASPVVEGKEDIAKQMEEVARRNPPHGRPHGTQDNMSEKWDGIQAAGANVKPFTKEGQNVDPQKAKQVADSFKDSLGMEAETCEEEESEDSAFDLDSLLDKLASDETEVQTGAPDQATSLLTDLVQMADELDSEGKFEAAAEIDQAIVAEVKAIRKKFAAKK